MKRLHLLCAAALVLACPACGGSTTDDAGVPMDGTTPTDGAHMGTDTGLPGTDSGLPGTDSGLPGTDSGLPGTDSGLPGTDSGTPGTDAGMTGTTCMSRADCATGEFCLHPLGMCAAAGTCTARPMTADCTGMVIMPVCGCDGNTYSAECIAHVNGISVDTTGMCLPPPMCPATAPPSGCCYRSSDCGGGMRCRGNDCTATPSVAGRCETPAMGGMCWSDFDCSFGGTARTCTGAVICPCGTTCTAPDMMGTCT